MQLKRKRRRKLRRTLFASSCALLGTTPAAMADGGDWSFDSGLLYYSEVDRVRAIEPALMAKRDFGDDTYLTSRFVVDSLTGATPTGAMPSDKGTTVTSASGTGGVGAGQLPMNDHFKDLRRAVTLTWSQPFADAWRWDLGGNYSLEHDFRSEGVNVLLARDFDRRNTTLSFGASYEGDDVFPIGGIQAPLSTVPSAPTPASGPIAGDKTKTVEGGLVGLTQVMNRAWILELNYSYGYSHGYLTDPYKVVSILNTHLGGSGVTGGFPILGPSIGDPLYNIYENRPPKHREKALFVLNKAYLGGSIVDFSWRYGWDDWGIRSHTYELRYRWPMGESSYLQPHLRYYRQTQADFYQRALLDTDPIPFVVGRDFVSADYRLAAITGRTLGIEWGTELEGGHSLRLRVERYEQGGKVDPRVIIGVQQGFNSFPELTAYIAQVSYSF